MVETGQIADFIKVATGVARLSTVELARRAKCSPQFLCDVGKGRRGVSLAIAERLARVLGGDPWVIVLLSGRLPRPVDIEEAIRLAHLLRQEADSAQTEMAGGKPCPPKPKAETRLAPPEWEV